MRSAFVPIRICAVTHQAARAAPEPHLRWSKHSKEPQACWMVLPTAFGRAAHQLQLPSSRVVGPVGTAGSQHSMHRQPPVWKCTWAACVTTATRRRGGAGPALKGAVRLDCTEVRKPVCCVAYAMSAEATLCRQIKRRQCQSKSACGKRSIRGTLHPLR